MIQSRHLLRWLVAFSVVTVSPASYADVRPGDEIGKTNASAADRLLSPGMRWAVAHGMPLKIGETRKITPDALYREATEKYASQVRIAPDGNTIEHYVAGRPFPDIDPRAPDAAAMVMFNYTMGTGIDDMYIPGFLIETGQFSPEDPLRIERKFLVGSLRRRYYVGRLYADPKPTIPNPSGYYCTEAFYPFVEPFDVKGMGVITHRYLDPRRADDSWIFFPSIRRVRRLAAMDGRFAEDYDQDSYGGYGGKVAWMQWRFLGRQEVLAAFHTNTSSIVWAPGAANWAFEGDWERRRMYVIEGIPKASDDPHARRVLYVDEEAFDVAYSDIYDRSGALWKVLINNFRYGPEDGAAQMLASIVVDAQESHVTRLTSGSVTPAEGNADTSESVYTIAGLIASSR